MTVENESEEQDRRELAYLNGRVREEAEAAVGASSIEATLIHVSRPPRTLDACKR